MADTRRYVEAISWAAVSEFTVTEDHLELLRHVHLYWDYGEGYGAPAIDPKRPYGNSDVERDIAEILEAPDSDWELLDGKYPIPLPTPGSASRACTSRRCSCSTSPWPPASSPASLHPR